MPRARPSAPVVQVTLQLFFGRLSFGSLYSIPHFLLILVFQTFRAGSIEIISTGSARSPAVGRPVIEIDLGVRRRNRARGGVNNDMVGVTVDRELPREEEENEGEDESFDFSDIFDDVGTLMKYGDVEDQYDYFLG